MNKSPSTCVWILGCFGPQRIVFLLIAPSSIPPTTLPTSFSALPIQRHPPSFPPLSLLALSNPTHHPFPPRSLLPLSNPTHLSLCSPYPSPPTTLPTSFSPSIAPEMRFSPVGSTFVKRIDLHVEASWEPRLCTPFSV